MLSAFLLCTSMVFSSACSGGGSSASAGEYTVWSLPSTVKVMQDDTDYDNKRPAQLVYDAVKGEYENYQLMLTAEDAIRSYSLATADLSGVAGTFSKDNFTVYNEWYVEVTMASTSAQMPGFYPDGLIPAELSAEAGENTVAAGCNQGIWVTVYIPENTAAGTYSGSFTLTVDGEETQIPVTLTVRDYVLSQESEMRTLFATREQRMLEGEFDSSVEMKEAYYEFFLDYRVNLNYLPIDTDEADEFVAVAQKYSVDERVNTYSFPANYTGGEWRSLTNWRNWLYAFAENATAECDIFEKLVWYYVDEPEGMYGAEAGTAWALSEIDAVKGMIREVYDEIVADRSDRFRGLKAIEGWENYFLDPPTVVTISIDSADSLKAATSIWSPGWGNFVNQSQRVTWENQTAAAYEAGTLQELWWYGCMGPKYPYPTYHIDDYLLSSRIVAWLQQRYGVTGNLYWSVETEQNVYNTPYFSGNPGYVDVSHLPTGDGYLVYPGAKYGHFGPLPSIRLMSVRDGAEEYELLMDLQHKYEDLKGVYGADYDSKALVSSLYERLADGLITTRDENLFDEVRTSLLDTIIEMQQPHGFLIDSFVVSDNKATVDFYVREGYRVTYNGQQLTGNNRRYSVVLDLTQNAYLELTIEGGEQTYQINKFISSPYYIIQNFDTDTLPEGIRVTGGEGSSAQLVASERGNALSVALQSEETEYAAYRLRLTIARQAFMENVDFSQVEDVTVTIINNCDFAYELNIWLSASGNERNYTTVTLQPGVNTVTFSVVNNEWDRAASVTEIIFEVANDAEALTLYKMTIDDLMFTRRGS